MKKYILFCFVLLSVRGISQVTGVYSLPSYDGRFTTYLTFYDCGNYSLELEEDLSPYFQSSLVLSYGKVRVNDSCIELIDIPYGFKLQLIRKDELLYCSSFFSYLNGLTLSKTTDVAGPESDKYCLDIKDLKKDYSVKKATIPMNFDGQYNSKNGYSLFFKANRKYELFYKSNLLSSGLWSQCENNVVLNDVKLRFTFHLLIQSEMHLESCYLPGDYIGVSLLKHSK